MSSSTSMPGVSVTAAATMIARSPRPARRTPQGEFPSPAEVTPVATRSPSPRKLPAAAASSPQIGFSSSGIANFRSCCEDLINLDDYPDLSVQDRVVINGFMRGDLLKNDKWRTLYPTGRYECTLQASKESKSSEFGCNEKIVFKIDFQRVSCSKSIVRRVWSSKTKADDTISDIGSESPIRASSYRSSHSRKRAPKQRRASLPEESESPTSATPKRSTSFPGSLPTRRGTPRRTSAEAEYSLIELQSPIKQAPKSTPKPGAKKRGRPPSAKTTPAKQAKSSSVKKTKPVPKQDQVWSVSSVLDHKVEGGKDLYLVRWDGLNEKGKPWDDTWEPKQNISRDLIAEYSNAHAKKKAKGSIGRKSRK